MSDKKDDKSELKSEVIVNSRRAWGRSEIGATNALQNMLANFRDDFNDTEIIEIFRVKGFKGMCGMQPQAEEFRSDVERLEVDGRELSKAQHHLEEAELVADKALAEGEELDEGKD